MYESQRGMNEYYKKIQQKMRKGKVDIAYAKIKSYFDSKGMRVNFMK